MVRQEARLHEPRSDGALVEEVDEAWVRHLLVEVAGLVEAEAPQQAAWYVATRPRTASGAPLPFGPAAVGPVAATATEVEVRLPPERRIEGVVQGPDGQGVRGVRVTATPVDAPKGFEGDVGEIGQHGSARSDERGTFRIGSLGDGSYRLAALASARLPSATRSSCSRGV